MIIHLLKTCSAFDYQETIEVKSYKNGFSNRPSKFPIPTIITTYKGIEITIPWSNIACIEE